MRCKLFTKTPKDEKLREKCLLNIDIRYVTCFLLANMTQKNGVCIFKLAKLVMRMYKGKHLKSQKAEDSNGGNQAECLI